MANREYWKERFIRMEQEQHKRDEAFIKDLEEQFRRASIHIQADIEKWYYRLAENNDITYTQAKKLLKADELDEFHWTVEEYIEKGIENDISQKWMKELENASARVHINRLQAIKLQIGQEAEMLYRKYHDGVESHLNKSYGDRFYHTAYEIAKGTGIGHNLARIDKRRIELVLEKPWAKDGANFSDRIWKNKEKLVNTLHTELAQHVIRGSDPYQAVQAVSKKMDVSKKQASTLVYTESAAAAAAAQKDCFKELDIEEFEVVATLDSITSELCRNMDGKHFPMKDYEVGVTANPFHPNCRSVTCPYFNDEFTEGEKRAARGEDGKTYYVPADMTYKEWQKEFVDKNERMGLKNDKPDDTIKQSGMKEEHDVHSVGKINRDIYKCVTDDIVTDEVIITDERIKHIKDRHPNDYEKFCGYLQEIVEDPQYIVESAKPNTALILKQFVDGTEQFKTVLRLKTSCDKPEYKNSIITFMKINDKEWSRMLRNKKILYKNE